MNIIAKAYAQAPTLEDVPDATQQVGAGDVLLPNLLLIVAIVGLFILLVYLPQKRRNREHNDMLNQLRKGDKVVTNGGMVGKVAKNPGETEVIIETGDGNKITILRAAITGKYDQIVGQNTQMANENKKETAKDDKSDETDQAKDA